MKEKKSFVLYSDLIHTTQLLSNEDAGKVFKWVLDYVNDNYPEPLEGLLSAVCEPIKQQLKRDLIKYEKKREQYSVAGKLSAESRRLKKEKEINERQRTLTNVEERSTKSTVSVNVSVNDNVNDINKQKVYSIEVNECFNSILDHFPKSLHPDTKKKKITWLKTIDELNRIDKIPFKHIKLVVKGIRNDDFWSRNFLSIHKLRKSNKEGIKYYIVFLEHLKSKKNESKNQKNGETKESFDINKY